MDHLEYLEWHYHVYGPPEEIEGPYSWSPPRSRSDSDSYSECEEKYGEEAEDEPAEEPAVVTGPAVTVEQDGGSSSSSSAKRHFLLDVDGIIDEDDHGITVPDMARAFLVPYHFNAEKLLQKLIKKGFFDHVSFK